MLVGLTPLEFGRLKLSVGYGTHKSNRPLAPGQVASLLRRACSNGASLADCAEALGMHQTNVRRLMRVLELAEDLRTLVTWGRVDGSIGFSSAVELTKLADPCDQKIAAESILKSRLDGKEVRQIAQIRNRSGRTIESCIEEVISMRPVIERRFVLIGTTGSEAISAALGKLPEERRNVILNTVIKELGWSGTTGHLGDRMFTLVGGPDFRQILARSGREVIESRIQKAILGRV